MPNTGSSSSQHVCVLCNSKLETKEELQDHFRFVFIHIMTFYDFNCRDVGGDCFSRVVYHDAMAISFGKSQSVVHNQYMPITEAILGHCMISRSIAKAKLQLSPPFS